MDAILQRLTTSDNGTFGVWITDKPLFTTLELPWKDNQKNVSCIPAGTYPVKKIYSMRFKRNVFLLSNVPNRDAVEIHVGNTVKDIQGCILVGMEYSMADYAIVSSGIALDKLMSIMPDEFNLTVKDTVCDVKDAKDL
jgi:hypothetical protein